ncbi:MAG: hypothetical protein Q9168_007964 [Polycauliona sp. 1 TL-2023]
MDTLSSTPKYGFFSFPAEIRRMIYRHLIPQKVNIFPHDSDKHRSTAPWNLISVSRQLRQEIRYEISSRVTAYIATRKILYNGAKNHKAYEAEMMSRDLYLGPPIQHLVINSVLEIKWKPNDHHTFDAPTWKRGILLPNKPTSSPLYKPRHDLSCVPIMYSSDYDTCAERIGNWQLLWRVPASRLAPCIPNIIKVLEAIDLEFQSQNPNDAAPGLRKMDLVRLVAAYRGIGFLIWQSIVHPEFPAEAADSYI